MPVKAGSTMADQGDFAPSHTFAFSASPLRADESWIESHAERTVVVRRGLPWSASPCSCRHSMGACDSASCSPKEDSVQLLMESSDSDKPVQLWTRRRCL